MRWQNPTLFYLFLLLPLVIFSFYFAQKIRRKRIEHFGPGVLQRVGQSLHPGRRRFKAFLAFAGFCFLILTLVSPQTLTKVEKKKKLGSEFLLALDTSLSMLAEDENPNRLLKAKEAMRTLIERLEGFKVGLIVFSGTSFVQCPMTLDHSAVRYFLESVDTESLPVPGTALKKVIKNAREGFGGDVGTRKYLVLFTDGEDVEGEDPVPEAREANREGITIFTIGFGSPPGTVIPLYENGRLLGYKKDAHGMTVTTRLEEGILSEMARASGGRYFRTSDAGKELDELLREVTKRGKKELRETSEKQYENRFQFPLFLALLALLLELTLSEARSLGPFAGQ